MPAWFGNENLYCIKLHSTKKKREYVFSVFYLKKKNNK